MSAPGVVPLLVHRWFADGEGWAYHPSVTPDEWREVKIAVSRAVEARGIQGAVGPSYLPAVDRTLVGVLRPDPAPLDPLARDRPGVFLGSFVLLPGEVAAPPGDDFLRGCDQRGGGAMARGADVGLWLPLPAHLSVSKPARRRFWLLLAVAMSIVACVGVAVALGPWRRPEAKQADLDRGKAATATPKDDNVVVVVGPDVLGLMREFVAELEGGDPGDERVCELFFLYLSRKQQPPARGLAHLADRLPEEPTWQRSGSARVPSAQTLRAALESLLGHLPARGGPALDARTASLRELVAEIRRRASTR